MPSRPRAIAIAVLTAAVLAGPVLAQSDLTGTTAGGAFYRIVVPGSWNGDLVIWNHGFSLSPPEQMPDLGPLVSVQLSEGFAVAASSYRMAGWALFKSNQDLRGLVDVFKTRVGTPGRVIITGASLGGAVTASALEKASLGNVAGALMLCGAVGGSRSWDGGLDLRLLYDAICSDVEGAALSGGATGLPKNSPLTEDDVAAAVNECTGVDLPKKRRSKQQKQNLARILELAQIPESFLQTDMRFATQGLADLIHDRGKMKGKQAVGNANVDYGDQKINESIARVEAKRKPARKLAKFFTPTGSVKGAKIISIHTDKDGLVVVENESEYAAVVPEENLTVGIVVEKSPSHCFFSPSEALAGWESLLLWLDGAAQPSVEDLQLACGAFEGLFGGPCRFDPGYVIPDMDERVRPR